MRLYEMTFEGDSDITAMSLVENPATESDALFLAEHKKAQVKLSTDNDKQEIIGVALLPDTPIYRRGKDGEEDYWIFFSRESVQRAMESFSQPNKKRSYTLEHQVPTSEVVTLSSWIVKDEESDIANTKYNLEAPKGSWILHSYIPDTSYWNSVIKAGNFSGYSLEGRFGQQIERTELSDDVLDSIIDSIKEIVTNHYN